MEKNFKKIIKTKTICTALSLLSIFSNTVTLKATTNTEKVNSLLESIYTEDPSQKNNEKIIKEEIYQRLRVARERNYSESISSDHSILNDSANCKDAFSKIYDTNFWGSDESKSGPGSKIESTENIREALPKIFESYNIKTVLDAPCGDYNWMKTVDKPSVKYIGADIVTDVIKKNNKNFKDENTTFKVIDITNDDIPKVDLIICRDCLQHLSQKNVKKAIKNFKKSGSKYLLVTNYPWTLENYDIKDGDFCAVNLCQSPFNFPINPIQKIKESVACGNCLDKHLYLYKLEDIDTDKMLIKPKTPNNIPIAMALDENYIYPTVVSITSAMENSNYKSIYDFYIMHSPDLSKESIDILNSLQDKYDNCRINLINMKDKYKSANVDSRITTPAYYRLALQDLLPNIEKIIYLDGDTLVLKDLSEMINIDMEGYCYKGFLDFPNYANHLKEHFSIENDHYICDGVMLVNLKELRRENATKKIDDFISINNKKLIQHDQTLVNALFANKVGILPAKFGIWNWFTFSIDNAKNWVNILISPEKYTEKEMINASFQPAILHCVRKPWDPIDVCGFTDIWWEYAQKTDVFDKIKKKYLISDGIYTIETSLNSEKVLDITGSCKDSEVKLQIWDKNNTDAQKFKIKYDQLGYYTIESICSGKMIDVPGASNKENIQLWQYENNDSKAQKWYILPNKDGSYRVISRCNGMNMDVDCAKTENGTKIQCHRANKTKAQDFRFIKLD